MKAAREEKQTLRARLRRLLREQNSREREKESREIVSRLKARAEYQGARTVLFYASTPEEVNIMPLLEEVLREEKKRAALPYFNAGERRMIPLAIDSLRDLEAGPYGVYRPRYRAERILSLSEIDCVLVPGLAFDRRGARLGKGKGYYDAFLSSLTCNTFKIGVGFSFQLLSKIPVEAHDAVLDAVVSAENI